MGLKIERIRAGLTQEELSALTGISTKTIGKYEKDPSQMTIKTASAIAKVLGCEVQKFLVQ